MPKFAANLTMMFNEVPFVDRFSAAAQAGFRGVEYLFPYDFDKDELAGLLKKHNLTQVLHNLPAGDWAKGERGIACDSTRVDEFKQGVRKAIEYAKALQCQQLNCLIGKVPEGQTPASVKSVVVDNLRYAAEQLKAQGIKLLIEPINTFDIPGFYLSRTLDAVALIAAVGSDNIFVQYDIYHMQRMEGELINTMKKYLPQIAHLQLADNPGRNEPGTGEIHYPNVFRAIDAMGYQGWIGCEYKPAKTTLEGLGWMKTQVH